MLDFLQRLRMQNLFDPNTMGQQTEPTFNMPMGPQGWDDPGMSAPQPNQSGDRIDEWLKQFYTPETTQQNRLNTLMDQYPQEPTPGKGRRIGGAIVGALADIGRMYGGVGNGRAAYDEITGKTKFREDIVNWKNKLDPAEKAATLEKQSNTNERTMAMQAIASKLREEAQHHKEQNDAVNAQIRQQRADVYEFKAHNPGLKLVMTKGGNVMAMDPVSGELKDTGIPSGSLSDADKLALTHDYTSQEIGQRGDVQSGLINQRHENTDEEIDRRGEQARTTKSTPSGTSSTNKPELPSQTRVRQLNKARELYNSRPDLRPFIKIVGNDFQVTAPGKNFLGSQTGPNDQQYKEINDAIYGGTVSPVPSHSTNTPNPPKGQGNNQPTLTAPKAPAGWKYVPKPGGGWTAVPDPTNKGG